MSVLNVKAQVGTFNLEMALVGAFSVISNLRVDLSLKLYSVPSSGAHVTWAQHVITAPPRY